MQGGVISMSSEILSANSLSCTSLFASRSLEREFQVSHSTFRVAKKSKTSGLKHETRNLKQLAPYASRFTRLKATRERS